VPFVYPDIFLVVNHNEIFVTKKEKGFHKKGFNNCLGKNLVDLLCFCKQSFIALASTLEYQMSYEELYKIKFLKISRNLE